MSKRVLIVNGHPDGRPERLCAALAEAYAEGAVQGGHEVRRIEVAKLSVPWLRTADAFLAPPASSDIVRAQDDILWAQHIVVVHPLWLGAAPAMLKAFMEQVACNGFFLDASARGFPKGKLQGRSARLVVSMGMPAVFYRLLYGAYGVRSFERGILGLAGIKPVRHTLLGGITDGSRHEASVGRVRTLGRRAA
jgi:putative NADPH-quinone reductase